MGLSKLDDNDFISLLNVPVKPPKHHKCKGFYEPLTGDYDCGYKAHRLTCDECRYGGGKKNPRALVNRL